MALTLAFANTGRALDKESTVYHARVRLHLHSLIHWWCEQDSDMGRPNGLRAGGVVHIMLAS